MRQKSETRAGLSIRTFRCRAKPALEIGEMATVGDIAKAEKVTDRFVSQTIRLVYLAPEVLERLVIRLEPAQYAVEQLCDMQREHGSHWLRKFGENADERTSKETEYCFEASDKGSDWQARIPAIGSGLGREHGGGG